MQCEQLTLNKIKDYLVCGHWEYFTINDDKSLESFWSEHDYGSVVKKVNELFQACGIENSYFFNANDIEFDDYRVGVFDHVNEVLVNVNGTQTLKKIIEIMPDPRRVNNSDDFALKLNDLLRHEGFELIQNKFGTYTLEYKQEAI